MVLKSYPEFSEADPTIDFMNASGALKLAYIWIERGQQAEAEALLEKVLNVVREQPRLGIAGHGIRDGQALTLLGRTDEAIQAFTQAVAEGYISSISFDGTELTRDVYLDTIRDRPELSNQVEIIEQRKAVMRARAEAAQSESDWLALRKLAQDA